MMNELSKMNAYSPNVTYSANITNGFYSVKFDKLAISQSIASVAATVEADGEKDFGEAPFKIDAEFGANISVKSSGTTDTGKVTVYGFDYLGQPMVEEFTRNNTSAVVGKKAFKYVSKVVVVKGVAATVTVERGLVLGLPYRTSKIVAETRDGVDSTTTKLVAPVNTKGTATSGDPRGTANLTTYSAPANVVLVCQASAEIFTIDDQKMGGLFGIPHFAG